MSGYLIDPTSGVSHMSKEIAGSRDYTASEDINDVRQLVALIKERPAVKKAGDRATLISYAELTMIEKRLVHALGQLAAGEAAEMRHGLRETAEALNFPRPMGATPVSLIPHSQRVIVALLREKGRLTTEQVSREVALDFDTTDALLDAMEARRLVRYDGFWNLL